MYCYSLADAVVSADAKEAFAIDEAQVLRFTAEDRAFVDSVGGAESCKTFYDRVCANIAAFPNFGIRLDNRVGSNADSNAEFGPGSDDRCRVYFHERSILTCFPS
jgi:hypothetical protein